MRLRPAPTERLRGYTLVDFESRSRCKLKKRGGRLYWQDPSTEALCAVLYHVESQRWYLWQPGDPSPRLDVAVAHNASKFDRFSEEPCGWRVREWADSSSAARRAGLPGALDALGKRWLGRDKDKAGSRFTLSLSQPSRAKATRGQLPTVTDEARARVIGYCASDVEIMVHAWGRLEPWLAVDADTCEVDTIVNDRGVCLDADMCRALQRQLHRQQDEAVHAAAKALGQRPDETRADAMSPQRFTRATGLPNAQAETLKDALKTTDQAGWREHAPHARVGASLRGMRALCEARLALASVVPGKLTAALERVSADGRLRDQLRYYGAHTGRWSSQGMQVHNLPRVGFEDDAKRLGGEWHCNEYVEALCEGALADKHLTKREVSGLLRACLVAEPGKVLMVLDYSGIEARANAWAAGDEAAVEVFRALDAGTGPDPYRVMAGRYLFGVDAAVVTKDQRGLGKIAELMLGYGAGADKFRESCEAGGANLAALGVEAEDVVSAYRNEAHPAIVAMWKACERAFRSACEGKAARAGKWRYEPHPSADGRGRGEVDVWCVLPSGRPIVYAKARAKRVMRTTKDGRKFQAWDLTYQGGLWPEHVYGGLLVENAIQALCRDFLADALVRCERAGLNPVLHVHDELVCEVDRRAGAEALEEQRQIMSDVPRWAKGLPIRLDGFVSERYRK